MLNNGTIKKHQPVARKVISISVYTMEKVTLLLTDCNNIAKYSQATEIDGCVYESSAASKQRDENGHCVAEREEDDADATEGVECSTGSEVDQAQT
jgi:hypothetical protein